MNCDRVGQIGKCDKIGKSGILDNFGIFIKNTYQEIFLSRNHFWVIKIFFLDKCVYQDLDMRFQELDKNIKNRCISC